MRLEAAGATESTPRITLAVSRVCIFGLTYSNGVLANVLGQVGNNDLAGELLGLVNGVDNSSDLLLLLLLLLLVLGGTSLGGGRGGLLDSTVSSSACSSSVLSVGSLGGSGDDLVEGLVEVGHG